ncbi:MAG TPA: hypothetical protein VK858_13890 [Longimicrobiales bacterium]|nr:hypothetical protein [Longimicrobiales bacterium]
MHLTRKRDGGRIDRFDHLRPARRRGRRCGAHEPEAGRTCTRPGGHRGLHAAHGQFGRLLAVWEPDARELGPSTDALATRAAAREARIARREDASGPVARLAAKVLRILSSPEELALAVLFLGLAAWGISVAVRIVSGW